MCRSRPHDWRETWTQSSAARPSTLGSAHPRIISYGRILQIYFSVAHDPTQLNRQGPDFGTQYRSAIFPTRVEQAKVADTYIAQLNRAKVFDARVVTKIEPNHTFYPAESYHQDFLARNPAYPYIAINDEGDGVRAPR
jgi:peptide-methionine (S)-S-oxide reductase